MGGKNKPQTQSVEPWKDQQPFLRQGFNEAQNLYGRGAVQYDLGGIVDQVRGGAGQSFGGAQSQLDQTIAGGYLGESNPYLQGLVNRANQNVMSGINSTFGGAGRTGGGIHQQSLAQGLGDVAASIYAPAYEAERGRQLQAISAVPQLYGSQLGVAGGLADLDERQQLADYENLQRYMQLIGGSYGQSSTTPGRSPLAGAAGGAAAGFGLTGEPTGALIGGALGGLGVI